MIQTGERGRMHGAADAMAVEEEEVEELEVVVVVVLLVVLVVEAEEEEEAVVVEEEGGRGEKARAGPPPFPLSQPALSPKPHRLLEGADMKVKTLPQPAAPAIDKDQK